MHDYKNIRYHPPKRMGLMRGFLMAIPVAILSGLVVGLAINFISSGHFLP